MRFAAKIPLPRQSTLFNYGQTAALTAGIRNAKADILITMDGDLQNDPKDIPMMLEVLQKM